MTVEIDYKDTLNGIVRDVLRMENVLESDQQTALEKIGKEIKKRVKEALPKSEESKSGYKHMRDDIKVLVHGKKKKTGVTGVTISGGKLTAYKWHMLDDGTRNPDGSIHTPAIHFTSKAMDKANPEIEKIVDELVREVTHD